MTKPHSSHLCGQSTKQWFTFKNVEHIYKSHAKYANFACGDYLRP